MLTPAFPSRWALAVACVAGASADHAAAQCSADRLAYPGQQEFSPGFGSSVGVWGDVVVVGAPTHMVGDDSTGAAFVYRRTSLTSWPLEQQLEADDAEANDYFGGSVAVGEGVLIVGASSADAAEPDSGAAYVYRFDGAAWQFEQKLAASDGVTSDGFGGPALSGDLAVFGAATADPHGSNSGAAYVFRYADGVWTEEAKLTPDIPGQDMYFGRAVAIDGTHIAVSAIGYDGFGGVVFLFEHVAGEWEQTHTLLSPDHLSGAVFGNDVAMDGDRLLVGTPGDSSGGTEQAGAAYAFAYDPDTNAWLLEAKLLASGRQDLDNYGSSVAISGDFALVGKNPHDPTEPATPAFFVWSGEWSQRGELRGFFDAGEAIFGGPVALAPETGVVGSRLDWENGVLPGAAFVFNMLACECAADFGADGVVDTRDVLAYLNAWAAGHPGADIVHDGSIDIRDFLAFLNLWVAGC